MALGAALGWAPRVTEEHSLWEIVAAIDGHNRANAIDEKTPAPTDDEFDALLMGASAASEET